MRHYLYESLAFAMHSKRPLERFLILFCSIGERSKACEKGMGSSSGISGMSISLRLSSSEII